MLALALVVGTVANVYLALPLTDKGRDLTTYKPFIGHFAAGSRARHCAMYFVTSLVY